MLGRFGAWMHRTRRVLTVVTVVTVVAGLLLLLIARADGVQGIGITYWQNQAQPCGTVGYDGLDWSLSADISQAATTCFLRAYTQCHAASLVEAEGVLFIRSWDTYLIEPALLAAGGHACSIQLNHTFGVAPASNPGWVVCADVAQRWYGLHFSGCGPSGDRFVGEAPPSQPPPGVACGDIQVPPTLIQPRVVDATGRAVVTCFMRARQTCQPAWAQVTVDGGGPVDRRLLLVEPSQQTCVVLELEWHAAWYGSQLLPLRHDSYYRPTLCTKLALTQYGLEVDSCGHARAEPIVLPICEGQRPIPPNTLCMPVPPAKN